MASEKLGQLNIDKKNCTFSPLCVDCTASKRRTKQQFPSFFLFTDFLREFILNHHIIAAGLSHPLFLTLIPTISSYQSLKLLHSAQLHIIMRIKKLEVTIVQFSDSKPNWIRIRMCTLVRGIRNESSKSYLKRRKKRARNKL